MSERRVLLICPPHLFGGSIEEILRVQADVVLIGMCRLGENVHQQIAKSRPDVIVLANVDTQSAEMIRLTSEVIEQHSEVTVIRAGLTEKFIRIFSSRLFPAHSVNLIEVIRDLPATYKT